MIGQNHKQADEGTLLRLFLWGVAYHKMGSRAGYEKWHGEADVLHAPRLQTGSS